MLIRTVPFKRSHPIRRLALLVAALAWVPALAEIPAAVDPLPPPANGWTLTEHDDGRAVEVQYRSAGGGLSAVCSNGNCNVFVEPASSCQPRMRYPLVFNSARRMGVMAGVCMVLADESGPRRVVHLQQRQSVFKAMLAGEDMTVAFPTASGAIDVIEVKMTGVMSLLQAAIAHRHDADTAPVAEAAAVTVPVKPDPIAIVLGRSATRYEL